MKLTTSANIPVYTISGSSTARPLPEWLARKRKRSLKQDPEYASRIELLQDFEFEEASNCVRVSEDGDWVVSTGTYKPQMHVHYLPHLALSYSRHTNTLNNTFILLSTDYSKSLHLQTDRSLEFHSPEGCRHTTRIPRYGRDLKYDRWSAEALIPSVGVNSSGNGEVYRLNLELGRFMTPYEVDVGGDDYTSLGGGSLQGGVGSGSVNAAAIGEASHNLLAFGTSLGTVEFWDPRSRSRVGLLPATSNFSAASDPILPNTRPEITCLNFKSSGLTLATGTSTGLIHLYDLRSPTPLLRKDQGYGYPIHTLTFLDSPTSTRASTASLGASDKILSADKRIIKIWDAADGSPWTSVEPAVDLNSVAWCPGSGMLLTANEGRQQHSFFIPSLGPAPKWCSFLDNLVEEMAEDSADPLAYNASSTNGTSHKAGEIYDNYRFVAVPELRALNLEHLVGRTGLLKPMMHGYLVNQQLYEEARLISQPEVWAERRQKSIRERIEKERESRIRGSKKAVTAKVNKRLAERVLEREEKNERRKAKRALEKGGDVEEEEQDKENTDQTPAAPPTDRVNVLTDTRFSALFQNEDFAIDETSHEFRALNPSTVPTTAGKDISRTRRGLTAVEEEELASHSTSSSGSSSSEDEEAEPDSAARQRGKGKPNKFTIKEKKAPAKVSSAAYTKKGHEPQNEYAARQAVQMRVSSSNSNGRPAAPARRDRSFGARAERLGGDARGVRKPGGGGRAGGEVVGERSISFMPGAGREKRVGARGDAEGGFGGGGGGGRGGGRGGRGGGGAGRKVDRRSASGNTFRRM